MTEIHCEKEREAYWKASKDYQEILKENRELLDKLYRLGELPPTSEEYLKNLEEAKRNERAAQEKFNDADRALYECLDESRSL